MTRQQKFTQKVINTKKWAIGMSSLPGEKELFEQQVQEDLGVAVAEKPRVKQPRLYRVLLHNDDYTTMDFVILILKSIFCHSEEEALRIMLTIHHKGVGTAGVYSYEIAETRVHKVIRLAREHEFPLHCSMEPE